MLYTPLGYTHFSLSTTFDYISKNSVADKFGLKKDDTILKIDNYSIYNSMRYLGVLGIYPGGEAVTLTVKREDAELVLKGNLGSRELIQKPSKMPF